MDDTSVANRCNHKVLRIEYDLPHSCTTSAILTNFINSAQTNPGKNLKKNLTGTISKHLTDICLVLSNYISVSAIEFLKCVGQTINFYDPVAKVLSPGPCGAIKSHYNLNNNKHSE